MKRLLCFSLSALIVLHVQSSRAQTAPVLLMVAAVGTGVVCTLYVWKTNTAQKMRWLVLNDDDMAGHLTPVATNRVFIGPTLTLAFPAFQVITDKRSPMGFWRITEICAPTNNFIPPKVQMVRGNVVICP